MPRSEQRAAGTRCNTNPTTGIRYGVLAGNNVPELLDTIQAEGTDHTLEALRDELKARLRRALADVLDDYGPRDRLADAIDYDTLLGKVEDAGLWDGGCDGEEHAWGYETETEHGTLRLALGWLGGAPLIYVTDSPWVAGCRNCSPCVPFAGDLDSPDADGRDAYCLPPCMLPDDWRGAEPRLREPQGVASCVSPG